MFGKPPYQVFFPGSDRSLYFHSYHHTIDSLVAKLQYLQSIVPNLFGYMKVVDSSEDPITIPAFLFVN